ncbi:MAG: hypothetical protein ABIA93_06080 [Candidatus Woesearchaeota archaeon]
MDIVNKWIEGFENSETNGKVRLAPPLPAPMRFIDGGSQIIFSAGHSTLGFIRIASVEFQGKERTQQKISEGLVLVKKNSSKYAIESENLKLHEEIDASDAESAFNEARRLLELKEALKPFQGITVLDGEARARNKKESEILKGLKRVIGFCKTSEDAETMSFASGNGAWYSGDGVQGYVKLHPKSERIFKIQFHEANLHDLESLQLHNDPAFLGYPYGLVVADQLARVSNEETSVMRIRAEIEAKDKKRFAKVKGARDAHSILDSARF